MSRIELEAAVGSVGSHVYLFEGNWPTGGYQVVLVVDDWSENEKLVADREGNLIVAQCIVNEHIGAICYLNR